MVVNHRYKLAVPNLKLARGTALEQIEVVGLLGAGGI
jgi:hypothetical protein